MSLVYTSHWRDATVYPHNRVRVSNNATRQILFTPLELKADRLPHDPSSLKVSLVKSINRQMEIIWQLFKYFFFDKFMMTWSTTSHGFPFPSQSRFRSTIKIGLFTRNCSCVVVITLNVAFLNSPPISKNFKWASEKRWSGGLYS